VVEEALVGAHFLGLDGLEQVLAVVSQRTHQVVLLIAAKRKGARNEQIMNEQVKIPSMYRERIDLSITNTVVLCT
jgi:hypothetical protein